MGHDPQLLRLTPTIGEAIGAWLRHRYPTNTAKHVARDTGVDPRTAENILGGHLSAVTLTKLARAYGWEFLSGVGAATIGETYEQALHRELEEIANEKRELEGREVRARGAWARVRARGAVDGGGLRLVPEEDLRSASEVGRRG